MQLTLSVGSADYTRNPPAETRGEDQVFASLEHLASWLNAWSHPTADRTNAGFFWCPSKLEPGSRSGQRPLWQVLPLDFDYTAPPPELAAYERITHESRSSTAEAPRWRVVLSLSRPIEHEDAVRLARYWGADNAATKPSQIFWGRHPERAAQHHAGALFDVDAYLPLLPPAEVRPDRPENEPGDADPATTARARQALAKLDGASLAYDVWRDCVWSAQAAGVPFDEVEAWSAALPNDKGDDHLYTVWALSKGAIGPGTLQLHAGMVHRPTFGQNLGATAAPAPGSGVPPSPVASAAAAVVSVGPIQTIPHELTVKGDKREASLPNLETLLSAQQSWRIGFDTFRDRIMVAPVGTEEWRTVTDVDMLDMRDKLERVENFAAVSAPMMRDALTLVANRFKFDSAIVWLSGLVWDGVPRVATFLATHCGATDDDYTRAVSYYVWTGLAGRVFAPGCQLDMVVAMQSPQGRKKSTGLAAMVPDVEFFTDGLSLHHERDDNFSRMLRGKLVVEIAELAGLTKADVNIVKRTITRRYEEWIEKYQTLPTRFARRCMMFGSANEMQMLPLDDTGNRRWLPVEIDTLDRAMIERDRDQLWAEGAAIYNARIAQLGNEDAIAWRDAERLAKQRHAQFEQTDIWETAITAWLDAPSAPAPGSSKVGPPPRTRPLTLSDVLTGALRMRVDQMDGKAEKRAARVLRQIGFEPRTVRLDSTRTCKRWVEIIPEPAAP